MELTARQLNRATLARQLLLERTAQPVVDGLRQVVALQAQEAASPYVALWNRLADFDPADLDAAFADHAVVKATLMRITLHAVVAADYPPLHAAMVHHLRRSRLGDRRYTATGLTVADADAGLSHLLAFATEPRSRADIEAMLAERIGEEHATGMWWALRTFAPLVHAPVGPPWTFGPRPAFRASPIEGERPDPDTALQHLVVRYLEGFGPASVADVAQFSMQPRGAVRAAVAALGERLVTFAGPDGAVLHDVPEASIPDDDTPAPPRLLGMWDSVLLAYADRSRIVTDEHRAEVIRRNGDVLPTLLVDGHVRGVWRPVEGGIEATAFEPLADDDWDGLAAEAADLHALLVARDPAVYGRYRHWWDKLPPGDTRLLPG